MKTRSSEIVNDRQKLKLKLKIKISTRIGLDLFDLLLVARWYPPSFTASKLEIPILGRPRSNEINLYLAITRVNFLQKAGINHRVEGMEGRRACRHDTVINCASFARLPHPWINFNWILLRARAGNVCNGTAGYIRRLAEGRIHGFRVSKSGEKAMSLDLFHLDLDNNELSQGIVLKDRTSYDWCPLSINTDYLSEVSTTF